MADFVFVIGSSGVGKSELCRRASLAGSGLLHKDLDLLENEAVAEMTAAGQDPKGWTGRWQRHLRFIADIESAPSENRMVVLADIGAGTLNAPEACQYLQAHSRKTLLVIAPVAVVAAHRQRDPEDLRRQEFTAERMAFYESFPHRLSVLEGGFDDLVPRFERAVRDVFARGASGAG